MVSLLNFSYSSRNTMVCDFNLHFSKDWRLSLFPCANLPAIHLLRWCVQIFWVIFFYQFVDLLSFQSSWYIGDVSVLSAVWLIRYMILSACSLYFILLPVSFEGQTFLHLIKSNLTICPFMDYAFDDESEKTPGQGYTKIFSFVTRF